MSETQRNYSSSISVGGRPLWNLKYADDIDLLAGTNEELQELTDQLSRSATRHGIVISTEISKVMLNTNDNSIHANITLYREKLEEVDKFCYMGSTLTRDGSCEADIRIRLGLATPARDGTVISYMEQQTNNFQIKT